MIDSKYNSWRIAKLFGRQEAMVASISRRQKGCDKLFSAGECFGMSEMFYKSGEREKAKEYLRKTIERCKTAYESDRELKAIA